MWGTFAENIRRTQGQEVSLRLAWKPTPHGEFTTASVYEALHLHVQGDQDKAIWRTGWRLKTAERVRVFMWRCIHKRIPTNSLTQKWDVWGMFQFE